MVVGTDRMAQTLGRMAQTWRCMRASSEGLEGQGDQAGGR